MIIRDMDLYFTHNCVDYGADTSEWKYDFDQDETVELSTKLTSILPSSFKGTNP